MGDIIKPDRALSTAILLEIISILNSDWNEWPDRKLELAAEGAFYVIAFCCGLQGEELPLVDLHGIAKHWLQSTTSEPPHIMIAILARLNGELGENYHLLPIVTITLSGIDNKLWIGRLVEEYAKVNNTTGPLFRNKLGSKIRAMILNLSFFII